MRYKKMWNDLIHKMNTDRAKLKEMLDIVREDNGNEGGIMFFLAIKQIDDFLKIMKALEREEIEYDTSRRG